MGQWPACTTWPQLAWWSRNYGHRSVPVELGRAGQPGWREEVVLLGRFVSEHLAPLVQREKLPAADSAAANQEPHSSKGEGTKVHMCSYGGGAEGDVGQMKDTGCHPADVAYLAQHPLLDQLPALARDIVVPPYCGSTGARITNVWIGTGARFPCTPEQTASASLALARITCCANRQTVLDRDSWALHCSHAHPAPCCLPCWTLPTIAVS